MSWGVSMSCRTVPEKVSEFLARCTGRKYCDTCIQERLGLKWRQQVQLITATLAVTPLFERETGVCCTCKEVKQVIYASNTSQLLTGLSPMPLVLQQTQPVQDQSGT
jgi:hypothetical protein